MPGIVIFGGTIEGRRLAEAFCDTTLQLYICVATEYGASLLPKAENIHICSKRMDEQEMECFLMEREIGYCVDATHPYAVEVTKNIIAACNKLDLPYIRVMRQEEPEWNGEEQKESKQKSEKQVQEDFYGKSGQGKVIFVTDVTEAAEYLSRANGRIFITTGSKELEKYTVIPDYQRRCVARVLPTLPVMEKCKELGFEGKNVIGMQGPFSEEMNYCMLEQTNADWLVTKNSGKVGGYTEKCEAALRLGINILVVGRPEEPTENGMSLEETIKFLRNCEAVVPQKKVLHRTIHLVAMGPGSDRLLTQEAVETLKQADVLIGAKRILEIWPQYTKKPQFINYKRDEIMRYLKDYPEYRNIAICYSGDIGFYSGARGIRELLEDEKIAALTKGDVEELQTEWDIHVVSGISSAVYFLNKIGVPWDEVELVSCHGQEKDLISVLKEKKRVCALLGKENDVPTICRQLLDCKMERIRLTIGEWLSYPEERIVTGSPEQFVNQEFDKLSLVLLECDAE